jgi:hypothetical protein
MATDNSEPRVGLISKIGVSAIVVLLATRALLTAYFDHETQAELQRKIGSAKPEALMNLRASEGTRLSSGAMPIDKAMAQLASRGRMGLGPELAPSASKDLAPLQGWVKMPSEVPPAMTAAALPEGRPGDAGAALSTSADAGVRARGTDGGAVKNKASREGGAP